MSGTSPPRGSLPALSRRAALLLLWVFIALYVANFGALSLLQNAAFETSAADMGNMNQAAWHTLHKGYPADSFEGIVVPRFAGHVEPFFYLLAVPYSLFQRAEMLLVLQSLGIALGAIPAYMLARSVLASQAAGLTMAAVYLLTPSLQAANLTEFHPVAFAAPFFLFSFYYLQKGSHLPFLFWAFLAASVKEDMSLLVAFLGLYALAHWARTRPRSNRRALAAGSLALTGGIAWFIICVYIIIPHFSATGSMVLFDRYSDVGGSPQGLLRTIFTNPLLVAQHLLAPEKISYLLGLLVSVGFLALAAPWALLLSAPSLGINMLSDYPPMYSGLSHYSAPIVPFVIIGAVYGTRTVAGALQRWRRLSAGRALAVCLGWLALSAFLYQTAVGFTPLSLQFRIPRVTAHHRDIAALAAQIPPDAVVSVQPPLQPHVSSRALVYPFPIVNDASFILLDVTARPTMHPNDLKSTIDRLLAQEGFGVLDARDGYILLQRGEAARSLPEGFYSAWRTPAAQPQYRVEVDFGPSLRLLGYDIEDIDEGRQPWTRARFYWQARGPLAPDLRLYPVYLDETGRIVEDTEQRPLVATLWYPLAEWREGERVVVETLPWPVGDRFRLAIGVVQGHDWGNAAARLPAQLIRFDVPVRRLEDGLLVEVGRFERRLKRLRLAPLQPAPRPARRIDARFGDEIALLGYDVQPGDAAARPGQTLELTLYWQALARPTIDYHTFTHVYDESGRVAAQSDGLTGGKQPTSWWFPGHVYTGTRVITIAADAPGALRPAIIVGVYDFDTGARLPVSLDRKAQGDALTIPLAP